MGRDDKKECELLERVIKVSIRTCTNNFSASNRCFACKGLCQLQNRK